MSIFGTSMEYWRGENLWKIERNRAGGGEGWWCVCVLVYLRYRNTTINLFRSETEKTAHSKITDHFFCNCLSLAQCKLNTDYWKLILLRDGRLCIRLITLLPVHLGPTRMKAFQSLSGALQLIGMQGLPMEAQQVIYGKDFYSLETTMKWKVLIVKAIACGQYDMNEIDYGKCKMPISEIGSLLFFKVFCKSQENLSGSWSQAYLLTASHDWTETRGALKGQYFRLSSKQHFGILGKGPAMLSRS